MRARIFHVVVEVVLVVLCRHWRGSTSWNSFRSSAGRCLVMVRPSICILSSVLSREGCSASSSCVGCCGAGAARGAPGGNGTIACDGVCGTYVLDRIRRLISLTMSLPSVVILPIMEMTTLMSLVHRCLCSSVCVS